MRLFILTLSLSFIALSAGAAPSDFKRQRTQIKFNEAIDSAKAESENERQQLMRSIKHSEKRKKISAKTKPRRKKSRRQ